MKKIIFIAIGTIIILGVVAVWTYLFMYGTPKNSDEVFTQFGFGTDAAPQIIIPDTTTIDVSSETVDGAPQKLRQLTTRPVAGAVITESGVRYVEQGTGHIYNIDLDTGVETLISGTTIPQTVDAVFSNDGLYFAITSLETSGNKTIVGALKLGQGNTGTTEGIALPIGATEVHFGSASGTVLYLLTETNGSSGYSYNIVKGNGVQLFAIPLRDVHVIWGNPIHVYTTPTASQEGHLYKVVKNSLTYTTPGGDGLMAFGYKGGILITVVEGEATRSYTLDETGRAQDLFLTFITEKCVEDPEGVHTLYCASPTDLGVHIFPDDWYKGIISYSDVLWKVDISKGEISGISDFLKESGREIDVIKIGTDDTGELIHFINKNDNTLWMFDTTL